MKAYKGIPHTCGWALYGDSGYGPQDSACGACKVGEMDAEDRAEAEALAAEGKERRSSYGDPNAAPVGVARKVVRGEGKCPTFYAFDGPWNAVG